MKIKVLMEGVHSHKEPKNNDVVCYFDKFCSNVILIKGEKNILVDTGNYSYKDMLIKALKENDLVPEDIDYVINTHIHNDHLANNHLFRNAIFVVNDGIWYWDGSHEVFGDCNDIKIPGVELIKTAGHTPYCISVIVRCDNKTYVVCGDLMSEEKIRKGKDVVVGDKQNTVKNVKKVFAFADVIIPGHGRVIDGDLLKELKGIVNRW